jgi:hypothetical protein
MPKAVGEFNIDSWDEKTYQELEDPAKLTRADVSQTFSGDIEGTGSVQWLMAYRPDGTARFVGLQRVEGSIGGKQGSFIAETAGDFDGAVARWVWTIVSGTGTGDLTGLEGQGTFEAPHGSKATFEAEYRLA